MSRDNNTLIYDAIGHNFTPAQVHDLAVAIATPEQIAAIAARLTVNNADGTPADPIPTAERLAVAENVHTYNAWKSQGLQVKGGEKALFSVMLWRWTDKPSKARRAEAAQAADNGDNSPASDPHYYMTRCYMFSAAQVGKPEPVHVKTPEEIAARNAELAAARKARRAAQQVAATTAPAAPTIPAPAPTPEPSKPAAVVAVVEHHTLHDDAPTPEPVQLDFATLAAQVLA